MNYTYKRVWGPLFWSCIHTTCLGYPEIPDEQVKHNYELFFISFGNIIPCLLCRPHYIDFLQKYPIRNYLDNRNKLFEWSVLLHNSVNLLLNNDIWTIEEALKQWGQKINYS